MRKFYVAKKKIILRLNKITNLLQFMNLTNSSKVELKNKEIE